VVTLVVAHLVTLSLSFLGQGMHLVTQEVSQAPAEVSLFPLLAGENKVETHSDPGWQKLDLEHF